ncbi:hypothetical protein BAY61_29070 [Prauserella marina]|nr:hypothetical protein BAY61_29070 [Prauserella marina]
MATVWAAGAVVAMLLVGCLVWLFGGAVVARRHAANAADLAALAAAGHVHSGPAVACASAQRIADRMEVRLGDCAFEQWDALVVVESEGKGMLAGFATITAKARAGPVECAGVCVGE